MISGCSGGGKSTLVAELARRGYATVEEPGRRIVAEALRSGSNALPWVDMASFARHAIALAREDRIEASTHARLVVFDRGLVDAAAALQHATGEAALAALGPGDRYHRRVFLAPPWPEVYVTDLERQHGFHDAVAEYERLVGAYRALDYEVILLPKVNVGDRADMFLRSVEM